MGSNLERVVEFICLVYHEARNVRHPLEKGYLDRGEEFKALVRLPRNRDKAWAAMAKVRRSAARSVSAKDVASVFHERLGLSLDQLVNLYKAPCWRKSALGGNRWAPICSKVKELVEALSTGDERRAAELFELIPKMEHNTGIVAEKLERLKKARDV